MSIGFITQDPLNNLTNLYQRPIFIMSNRLPTSADVQPAGTQWQNGLGGTIYQTPGSGVWNPISSAAGTLSTLTGDSGGAISPSSGNITLAGTAHQLTTVGSGSTITFS